MRPWLQTIGWLSCVVYATIPAFWLMIHPFAQRWRARQRSPYLLLVPLWMAMWIAVALLTRPWRTIELYRANWTWFIAASLFACGISIYGRSGKNFSRKQLVGLPELRGDFTSKNAPKLATDGIRFHVRHPVYLAHLCEMLAWTIGTGLTVCWALTAFAIVAGAAMIRTEDAELEMRFGEDYRAYRKAVPAILPSLEKRQL